MTTQIKPGDLVMLPRGGVIVRVDDVFEWTDKQGRPHDMLTYWNWHAHRGCPVEADCNRWGSIDALAVTLVVPTTSTPIVPGDDPPERAQ